jgi:hypothetical protein
MVGVQPDLTFIVYLLPLPMRGLFLPPAQRGLLSVQACKCPFHRHFLHFSERAKRSSARSKKCNLCPFHRGLRACTARNPPGRRGGRT